MGISKDWPGYNKGVEHDDGFEWKWQDAIPADLPNRDPPVVSIPFGYEKKILSKGWKKTPQNRALDLDITFEKDVEIVMRDGVKVGLVTHDSLTRLCLTEILQALCRHLQTRGHKWREGSHHNGLFTIWERWFRRQLDGCRSIPSWGSEKSTEWS